MKILVVNAGTGDSSGLREVNTYSAIHWAISFLNGKRSVSGAGSSS